MSVALPLATSSRPGPSLALGEVATGLGSSRPGPSLAATELRSLGPGPSHERALQLSYLDPDLVLATGLPHQTWSSHWQGAATGLPHPDLVLGLALPLDYLIPGPSLALGHWTTSGRGRPGPSQWQGPATGLPHPDLVLASPCHWTTSSSGPRPRPATGLPHPPGPSLALPLDYLIQTWSSLALPLDYLVQTWSALPLY